MLEVADGWSLAGGRAAGRVGGGAWGGLLEGGVDREGLLEVGGGCPLAEEETEVE